MPLAASSSPHLAQNGFITNLHPFEHWSVAVGYPPAHLGSRWVLRCKGSRGQEGTQNTRWESPLEGPVRQRPPAAGFKWQKLRTPLISCPPLRAPITYQGYKNILSRPKIPRSVYAPGCARHEVPRLGVLRKVGASGLSRAKRAQSFSRVPASQ